MPHASDYYQSRNSSVFGRLLAPSQQRSQTKDAREFVKTVPRFSEGSCSSPGGEEMSVGRPKEASSPEDPCQLYSAPGETG